tara:strand:+ start:59 stop:1432 length:1374 start_codon:yes stop_codon:yes gene_type:complete
MIDNKNIDKIYYLFLFTHLILWTFIPSISNENLPLDTIEALAWGSDLEWGYSKHPPLSAFAVEIFFKIFGNQDWAFYLLSQFFIIIAFIGIFELSKELFKSKILALISILLLEGIYFYNFTTPEFNVNISQLPFWSLSLYFTWRCIKNDNLPDFIFLGIFLSLGILSKYLFIYLAAGIKFLFIFLLIKGKQIDLLKVFLTGFISLLILSPHLLWLFENNFSTLAYGLERTGGIGKFSDHIIYPTIFIIKQLGILIPFILLCYTLINKFKPKINFQDSKIIFSFFTILVPIILMIITSFIMGAKIRTMWMTPFYLGAGIIIIEIFKNYIHIRKLKNFYFLSIFFLFFSPLLYFCVSIIDDTKRTDYPGKEISRLVQNKWDDNFTNKIKIVIGDEWSAGNLSYHLESRPIWLNELKDKTFKIQEDQGVIYTGNPKILKKVCPGVFGSIKPVGYCMIGSK